QTELTLFAFMCNTIRKFCIIDGLERSLSRVNERMGFRIFQPFPKTVIHTILHLPRPECCIITHLWLKYSPIERTYIDRMLLVSGMEFSKQNIGPLHKPIKSTHDLG